MKQCQSCHRVYEDSTLMFCLDDGATLKEIRSINYGSDPTLALRTGENPFPPPTQPAISINDKPLQTHFREAAANSAVRPRANYLAWILVGLLSFCLIGLVGGLGIKYLIDSVREPKNDSSLISKTTTPIPVVFDTLKARLPSKVGRFDQLGINSKMDDYAAQDYAATEVLTAGYSEKVMVILSKHKNADDAGRMVKDFVKKATDGAAPPYSITQRKAVTNKKGEMVGELIVLRNTDPQVHTRPGYGTPSFILLNRKEVVYRIYGYTKDGDALDFYTALPFD